MTGRCALVIAAYFGNRRRPPQTQEENLEMIRFYTAAALVVDPGVDTDIIISVNEACRKDIGNIRWYHQCMRFVNRIDGMPAARGVFKVIKQENIGLSYGAYSAAYMNWRDEYQYYQFTEDDHILVGNNYLSQAIQQLEHNSEVGVVCTLSVGAPTENKFPPYAKGGICTISSKLLERVRPHFFSEEFPNGRLPHRHESNESLRARRPDAHQYLMHGGASEVEFTHFMSKTFQKKLAYLRAENVLMAWKRGLAYVEHNPRVAPWPCRLESRDKRGKGADESRDGDWG